METIPHQPSSLVSIYIKQIFCGFEILSQLYSTLMMGMLGMLGWGSIRQPHKLPILIPLFLLWLWVGEEKEFSSYAMYFTYVL